MKNKAVHITQKIKGKTVSFIKGQKTLTIKKINGLRPTIETYYDIKLALELKHGEGFRWATFSVPFKTV